MFSNKCFNTQKSEPCNLHMVCEKSGKQGMFITEKLISDIVKRDVTLQSEGSSV